MSHSTPHLDRRHFLALGTAAVVAAGDPAFAQSPS